MHAFTGPLPRVCGGPQSQKNKIFKANCYSTNCSRTSGSFTGWGEKTNKRTYFQDICFIFYKAVVKKIQYWCSQLHINYWALEPFLATTIYTSTWVAKGFEQNRRYCFKVGMLEKLLLALLTSATHLCKYHGGLQISLQMKGRTKIPAKCKQLQQNYPNVVLFCIEEHHGILQSKQVKENQFNWETN